MSGIRSTNTRPEIVVRRALHGLGYRFRLGSKVGKIKPDVVLRQRQIAVFVHGCYWHQHPGCRLAYSDREYSQEWKKKFVDNRNRDQRVEKQLLMDGWRVAVFWECSTRHADFLSDEMERFCCWVDQGENTYFEASMIVR